MDDFDIEIDPRRYDFRATVHGGTVPEYFTLKWEKTDTYPGVTSDQFDTAFRAFFDSLAENYAVEVEMEGYASANLREPFYVGGEVEEDPNLPGDPGTDDERETNNPDRP